ncbi:TRAP transporter TatT component family protein [Thiovibrio sp. JS02]
MLKNFQAWGAVVGKASGNFSSVAKNGFLAVALLFLSGCASLFITPVVEPVVRNLNRQSDLELVCDGAPAYLLMLDSLIAGNPDNEKLLLSGVQAYSAYATIMPECPGRAQRAAVLSERAREYGLRLLRLSGLAASTPGQAVADFSTSLAAVDRAGVEKLFWAGYGWATWIGLQQGAPAAMAELPKVEQLMLRVLALDEGYYNGGSHLFLAIYYGSRPALLGGNPEASRGHFDRALVLSQRRFLPALVAYAEHYARQTFDRELYESLLAEVLAFDLASAPELTLPNVVAKRRALRLLAKTDEYF